MPIPTPEATELSVTLEHESDELQPPSTFIQEMDARDAAFRAGRVMFRDSPTAQRIRGRSGIVPIGPPKFDDEEKAPPQFKEQEEGGRDSDESEPDTEDTGEQPRSPG